MKPIFYPILYRVLCRKCPWQGRRREKPNFSVLEPGYYPCRPKPCPLCGSDELDFFLVWGRN